MDLLPIFVNLAARRVVVIGGGLGAARKTESALRSGGVVAVYAAALSEEFAPLSGRFEHIATGLKGDSFEGCALCYFASEGGEVDPELLLGRHLRRLRRVSLLLLLLRRS